MGQYSKGVYIIAVSEIKGAPCARRAHFRGRVHDFLRVYHYYIVELSSRRVHGENPGCTVLREVHPVGAQNKTLISDTALILDKRVSYLLHGGSHLGRIAYR